MSQRVNIEEFQSYKQVTFYTVRYDDEEYSQTDRFILRYKDTDYAEYLLELINIIENIGEYGGIDGGNIFRMENNARALPPDRSHKTRYLGLRTDPPLRLFCYCVSDEIVILFDGGVKSATSVQDCPTLRMPFQEAQKLSRVIQQEIAEASITHSGKILYGKQKEIFFFN